MPPTVGMVGAVLTLMVMLEVLEQVPLLSSHCSTDGPELNPVTVADGELIGEMATAGPDITDHVLEPAVPELAASVAVPGFEQITWLDPALATPGVAKVCTVRLATLGLQPGV